MLKNYFKKRKLNIICSIAAIVMMVIVWIIAYYSVKNDYVVPSFSDTLSSLCGCLKSGVFWIAFFNTFGRTLLAFIISFVLAGCLAALSIISKAFSAFINPIMVFLRTLPTLAVILILLIWTSPKTAPVIVTALVLFPMIYAQITAAFGGIDRGLTEMAKVYKLSNRDKLFNIYLPSVTPNVLAQTGADISLGIKVMISAEVLANTYRSLGGLMQNARLYLEMPRLAALTLAAVILGLVVEFAFSQFERITFKWSRKEGRGD